MQRKSEAGGSIGALIIGDSDVYLGDLDVGPLPVAFLCVFLFDPDNYFSRDRTNLVLIIDQVIAFPTIGDKKTAVDETARIDTTTPKPSARNLVYTDIPDGQQGRHHRNALSVAWRVTFTQNLPVSKQAMTQNPFEGVIDA